MSLNKYIENAIEALQKLNSAQKSNLDTASSILVDAIVNGNSIYSFGASHSFIMTEEMVYRTGGLMLVNPIYPHGMNLLVRPLTQTSKLERVLGLGTELLEGSPAKPGDVLIVSSTSGRNAVAIDIACAAQSKGIKVVGITSIAYSSGVTSRHPSGKKMMDFCDVVIDNQAPYGDASVEIAGFPQKVGPLSTVTGCVIVNALAAEVVSRLVDMGIEPPVFLSANLDGGDEYNARLLAKNSDRIHYLD
jgi:uncharacterized phosphosugar-binding protein